MDIILPIINDEYISPPNIAEKIKANVNSSTFY